MTTAPRTARQSTAPGADNLLSGARAAREAAARFRQEVERFRAVSFEETLAASAEMRLAARQIASGCAPHEAVERARAAVASRRAPAAETPLMAAE